MPLARLLGPRLTQRWNVPVVVENKVGAGGIIGIEAAARANPDGYSFLFAATSFSTLPALRTKLPYDPLKNFAPIVMLGASPLVLIVANKVPAKTVRGHSHQAVELGIALIASGKYPFEKMGTHTFDLNAVREALLTVGREGDPSAMHCCVNPWA